MPSDFVFLTSSKRLLSDIVESVGGECSDIPERYLNFFEHTFEDGDVSAIPLLGLTRNLELLDKEEKELYIDLVTKINESEWPDFDSIEEIDADRMISPEEGWDFVEDNLGTSEKVQKALKGVIESVIGGGISSIRSKDGKFPSAKNNFLLEKDGTFAGTFKVGDHTLEFEVAPTENGWLCTYRVSEKSLDKLEEPANKTRRSKTGFNRRRVRNRGW